MITLFCSEPFAPSRPDPAYLAEVEAAGEAGFASALVDFEALSADGNPARAVRNIPRYDQEVIGIYRGWMLSPESYRQLYITLRERGIRLVNTPEQYRHCHYFPDSYGTIAAHTPASVVIPMAGRTLPDFREVGMLLKRFGGKPLVVKDYVKSRKHEWLEACFIPDASDIVAVERITSRFIELQGDDLAGGLVFREFVELEALERHSRSGMPLTQEFRRFYCEGNLFFATEYWEEGTYTLDIPDELLFRQVAGAIGSNFFTMDIARKADGEWIIIELGDGQVAGIPERSDLRAFYRNLRIALRGLSL